MRFKVSFKNSKPILFKLKSAHFNAKHPHKICCYNNGAYSDVSWVFCASTSAGKCR